MPLYPPTSSAARDPFPLSGYGVLAASGDPNEFQRPGGTSSGDRFFARMLIPANVTITNLWCAVTTAGTWDAVSTPNQLALYDDTGVQLATTTDTSTTWTTAGWRGGALSVAQAAQGSDRYVYAAMIQRGMTGLQLAFPVSGTDNQAWFAVGPSGTGVVNRRGIYVSGTSLPASFTPSSFGAATSFIPLFAVT